MPRVSIDIPSGLSSSSIEIVRVRVKKTIYEILTTKEEKYDYVVIREVHAEIGDGAPFISIDLRPGRSSKQKQAFVDIVAEIIFDELGIEREDIYILFRETEAANHFCGGKPISDFVPPELR